MKNYVVQYLWNFVVSHHWSCCASYGSMDYGILLSFFYTDVLFHMYGIVLFHTQRIEMFHTHTDLWTCYFPYVWNCVLISRVVTFHIRNGDVPYPQNCLFHINLMDYKITHLCIVLHQCISQDYTIRNILVLLILERYRILYIF